MTTLHRPHRPKFWLSTPVLLSFLALGLTLACGETPLPSPFKDPAVECNVDSGCTNPAKPICDSLKGCVECQYDDECSPDEDCELGTCVERTKCATNTDCRNSAEPHCKPEGTYCVECLTSEQCAEDQRCRDNHCEKVEICINSRDCLNDKVCDRTEGACVECTSPSDCAEDKTCVDQACVLKCSSDKDCASLDLLCGKEQGYCVECIADADCPDAYSCNSGVCAEDTCRPGQTECDEDGSGLTRCDSRGAFVERLPCSFGTACRQKSGADTCDAWLCVPESSHCTSNVELETCDSSGFSANSLDCSEQGGACENGVCAEVVCKPGEFKCMGAVSMQCNALGTELAPAKSCLMIEYCSEETGHCATDVCGGGTSRCEGNKIAHCNSDGSSYGPATECPTSGDTCYNDKCLPVVCEGDFQCLDDSIYACWDSGTRRTLRETCTENEYCDADRELPACMPFKCSPGETSCVGDEAGVCNAEGSGVDNGKDCTDTDQKCRDGTCHDVICTEPYVCSGSSVYECNISGTELTWLDSCDPNRHCDSTFGTCASDICEQDKPACDGNLATTCNADGSGYLTGGTPCNQDEACVNGTCLPVICAPSSYYCQNGNPFHCGPDGTTSQLSDTCSANEYCAPGEWTCRFDVCTAGSPVCSGSALSSCASDGSGPKDAGTPCPTAQTCVSGSCAPVVCEADSYHCSATGNVERCNATGTAYQSWSTCTTATYCDVSGTPTCLPDICPALGPTCDGETLATCDSLGGGYESPGADCSASGMVCSPSGCVSSELTAPFSSFTAGSSSGTNGYMNRFVATSSRTLTEIQQYFTVTGTSQFMFYVLSGSSPGGSVSKIFEKVVTASPSGTYVSSGAIDVSLVRGQVYDIGVRVVGSHTYAAQNMSGAIFFGWGHLDGSYSSTSTFSESTTPSLNLRGYVQNLTLGPVN